MEATKPISSHPKVRKSALLKLLRKKRMFVIRELLNRNDLIEWAITEGFQEIVPATALHVTVGKFHDPNVGRQLVPAAQDLTVRASQRRAVLNFGGIVVLAFGGQNKSSPKSYAKVEQNANLCDPPQPGWQTKRSKSVRHLMFGIPGVNAGKVDMLPTEG